MLSDFFVRRGKGLEPFRKGVGGIEKILKWILTNSGDRTRASSVTATPIKNRLANMAESRDEKKIMCKHLRFVPPFQQLNDCSSLSS